ncbi:MAG: glycosyltransferase family 4 protein [Gemmatimonadaceae bacterium]
MRAPHIASRPRLLWVNHFAVAPDMGGATRHVEMGRELVKLGWDVTIAASDFHLHRRTYLRRSASSDRAPCEEHLDGVRLMWLWASPYERNDLRRIGNWLSFGGSLLRLDRAAISPDVVIGSTPHLFAALAAWRLARQIGVPFILEVRDLWPESLDVGGGRRGAGYHALHALARFLYRSADAIVVLADGVARYLARSGVPEAKIAVVPNGVDLALFDRDSLAEPRHALRIGYAGAHGPANGLEAVLDAAAELRDDPRIRFVLVGDGPAKSSLVERARSLQLENIEFVAPVPKSAMPDFLCGCDAGLMVLKDVALFSFGVSPNKLFDYWAAALPVICNVPGEVAGLVTDAHGGVQAADASAGALARAIRCLVAMQPDERRALGVSGREWVRHERDRPVLAARLDRALRPYLRAPSRAAS